MQVSFRQLLPLACFCLILFPITGGNAQILINEYSAANLDRDPDDFDKHEDWIELYNKGAVPVNLNGWHLSDSEDDPTQWTIKEDLQIEAGGYMLFWCSGRDQGIHTNFKLTQTKNTAEVITVANPGGNVVDKREMKKNQVNHSRGRTTDGNAKWSIFTEPTPGTSNDNSTPYESYAAKPDFNVDAGFYTTSQTVEITNDEPDSEMRFTLDGTAPTATSLLYQGPILLSSTKVLKARIFSNDPTVLPGFIEYRTYFINDSFTLPVVSVAGTNLLQLANGDNTLRPYGSIEYFGTDRLLKTRSYGELNSHGQDSWVNHQRSIDWVSRDEMGYSRHLKEKIFSQSDRDEFQRVILRAAGDDNYPDGSNIPGGGAHLRDAFIQNLADRNNLNLDVRRGEKAILYLNGRYWGVYDLRELVDDSDYTEYYYNQDKYNIQYILTWGSTWAQYGGTEALDDFQQTQDFIFDNDMTVQSNFDSVAAMIDLQSMVDYVIVNSASVCSDWLNWNTGWWRGLNPDGSHNKWGFILWDNDATFGYYINYTGIPDTTANASPCDVETLVDVDSFFYDEYLELAQDTFFDPGSGTWFFPGDTIYYSPSGWYTLVADANNHMASLLKLRENPGFNEFYIARYADLMNTMFNCDTMLNFLESQYNLIKPEMPRHIARFGGSMQEWEHNYQKLKYFISQRCERLPEAMTTCYNIDGPYEVTFDVDPPGEGSLKINTMTINEFPYTAKYFGGIDTHVEAVVRDPDAYYFDSWATTGLSTPDSNSLALIQVQSPGTVTAHFAVLISGTTDFELKGYSFSVQPNITTGNVSAFFDLPMADNVKVQLFDMLGHPVQMLLQSNQLQAGPYRLELDLNAAGLTAGTYIMHIRTENGFVKNERVVLQQ
ncbi:MAG TPA: CotH kinase family protein [Saprospiraceae bacterium]|nr:CotH kinase family protein [Saprospiraceae bacterium]